ncbi:MAG: urease accessory protein UreF [Acetobacteraceae bacterium]|nr:urease accessory protein UreF [Acetobacteraceae bacterium]
MPGAIITTTTTTEALRLLLTWLSPAFPTGGFAYSHGLEWAVEAGDVGNERSLSDWLHDVFLHGSPWSDAILLRRAHAAQPDDLAALCDLGIALSFGSERRLETIAQGAAFTRAVTIWGGARVTRLTSQHSPYPVAVGAAAADQGIAADLAVAAYLQAVAANLVSAGIRLIPLGQTAGLRVLAGLTPVLAEVTETSAAATLDDIGTACFRADIATLRHETQHTRLFRT